MTFVGLYCWLLLHHSFHQSSSSGSSSSSSSSNSGSNSSKSNSGNSKGSGSGSDGDQDDEEEDAQESNWQKELEALKNAELAKKRAIAQAKAMETMKFLKRTNIFGSPNPLSLGEPEEYMVKYREVLESPMITIGAKAQRVVEILEDLFARSWILSRHLAVILECFYDLGYYKNTKDHGTYRVDLLIALFARVVDLHNFECVWDCLSPMEIASTYCRLGFLNLYNPCKPEGAWELDMSRREERIVAKTLCVLATQEPGDNWSFKTFRWMRSMESMPGWELTQPWLTEEGMPMRGLVNIYYYSGEGQQKKGCKASVGVRKALLNLVSKWSCIIVVTYRFVQM